MTALHEFYGVAASREKWEIFICDLGNRRSRKGSEYLTERRRALVLCTSKSSEVDGGTPSITTKLSAQLCDASERGSASALPTSFRNVR